RESFSFRKRTAVRPERKLSIQQALLDSSIRVDPAVAQERPVRPLLVHPRPIDFADHDFLFIHRTFGNDFAIGTANETLSPEFNSVSAGRRFMTDSIRGGDVAAVCDRVTALNGFPGRMLGRPKLFFLAWMPADRRWIKNNLRAVQRRQ